MRPSFLVSLLVVISCGPNPNPGDSSVGDSSRTYVNRVRPASPNQAPSPIPTPSDGAPQRATRDTRRGPAFPVVGGRFQYESGTGQVTVGPSAAEGECLLTATHEHAGGQLRATRAVPCGSAEELVPNLVHLANLDGDHVEELYFSLQVSGSTNSIWFALVTKEGGAQVLPERAYDSAGDELPLRGYALPAGNEEFGRIGRALWLGQDPGLREIVVTRTGVNHHSQGELVFELTPTGTGHPNKSVLVEYGGTPTENPVFRRVLGSRHDGGFTRFYAGDVDADGDDEFFAFAMFGCSDCWEQPAEVWAFDDGQSILLATGVLDGAGHGSDTATGIENVSPVEAYILRLCGRDYRRRLEEQVVRP